LIEGFGNLGELLCAKRKKKSFVHCFTLLMLVLNVLWSREGMQISRLIDGFQYEADASPLSALCTGL
jgi:hypothetical protein